MVFSQLGFQLCSGPAFFQIKLKWINWPSHPVCFSKLSTGHFWPSSASVSGVETLAGLLYACLYIDKWYAFFISSIQAYSSSIQNVSVPSRVYFMNFSKEKASIGSSMFNLFAEFSFVIALICYTNMVSIPGGTHHVLIFDQRIFLFICPNEKGTPYPEDNKWCGPCQPRRLVAVKSLTILYLVVGVI